MTSKDEIYMSLNICRTVHVLEFIWLWSGQMYSPPKEKPATTNGAGGTRVRRRWRWPYVVCQIVCLFCERDWRNLCLYLHHQMRSYAYQGLLHQRIHCLHNLQENEPAHVVVWSPSACDSVNYMAGTIQGRYSKESNFMYGTIRTGPPLSSALMIVNSSTFFPPIVLSLWLTRRDNITGLQLLESQSATVTSQ